MKNMNIPQNLIIETVKKTKRICGKYGEMNIDVPQDRDSSFEPKIVPKRKKDISAIEEKS